MGERKEVIKLERLFRDTDEGVTVLYDKDGNEYGAFIWSIGNDYGSVGARLITLGGTIWDNPLIFGVAVRNWEGEGYLYDADFDGELRTFKNTEEADEVATKYVLDILEEDNYIEK